MWGCHLKNFHFYVLLGVLLSFTITGEAELFHSKTAIEKTAFLFGHGLHKVANFLKGAIKTFSPTFIATEKCERRYRNEIMFWKGTFFIQAVKEIVTTLLSVSNRLLY